MSGCTTPADGTRTCASLTVGGLFALRLDIDWYCGSSCVVGRGGVSGGPLTALFSCSRGSDFLRRPTCLIHTEILEYPSTPPPRSCKFRQQSSVRLSYDGPSVREIKAAVEALLLASKTQTRRHFPVLLVLVWESRNRRIFFLPWRGRPSCDQLSSETQSFCSRCLYNTSCEAVNMCTEQL